MKLAFKPYGPEALLVSFGNEINETIHLQVKFLYEALRKKAKWGVEAVIPSYCSLTIMFEPKLITNETLKELCDQLILSYQSEGNSTRIIEIPVCYDEEFGIDLEVVKNHTGLNKSEIISSHTSKEYLVYMLGFVPGFLYLGGMDEKLKTPRRKTPRLKVEKGAVGIADDQTGIYPIEIPGGWQIIGKTPIDLLSDKLESQIRMGDRVKFKSISKEEFKTWDK